MFHINFLRISRFIRIKVLLISCLFIYLFISIQQNITRISFHPDEFDYLARGVFFDLLINRDFSNIAWQTYDSYVHEKLPSFIYRIPFRLFYIDDLKMVRLRNIQDSWWKETGNCNEYKPIYCYSFLPNRWSEFDVYQSFDGLPKTFQQQYFPMIITRKIAALFSFGILILFTLILYKLTNILFSCIGALMLYSINNYQVTTIRGWGDVFLLFFLLLSFYFGLIWSKSFYYKHSIVKIIIIGFCCGLATASKLNGAISLVYIIGLLGLQLINHFSCDKIKIFFLNSLACISISAIIFVVLNPFTWGHPIQNTLFMAQHRINETHYFQRQYNNYNLPTIKSRLSYMIDYTLFQQNAFPIDKYHIPIDAVLCSIGLLSLMINIFKKREFKEQALLYYLLTTYIIMSLYLGVNLDRYLLPIIPAVIMVEIYGLKSLSDILFHKIIHFRNL